MAEIPTLRQATPEDEPFLERMCYLAAFSINGKIQDSKDIPKTLEEARKLDWFPEYTKKWGQKSGDYGLIAVDGDGKDIGAAWYREYRDSDPPVRQISIAVEHDQQTRKGIGETLMRGLLAHANEGGIDILELQVEPENTRAISLYSKLGFISVGNHEGLEVMQGSTDLPFA